MSAADQLGQLLVSRQLVAPGELAKALSEQQECGGRLGAILVRRGSISEHDLVRALAGQLRLPVARIRGKTVNPEVLALVPVQVAEKYRCLPLFRRPRDGAEVLFLAMEDPSDRDALDELSFQLGERLQPVLIGPAELEDALQRHYHLDAQAGAGDPLSPMPPPDAGDADTDTAPELPPADPLLHPAPPSGQATQPRLGSGPPAAGPRRAPPARPPVAERDPTPEEPPAAPPRVLLRALSELLLEKGVIDRDELARRLRDLGAGERNSG